jgi:hypothetical protein
VRRLWVRFGAVIALILGLLAANPFESSAAPHERRVREPTREKSGGAEGRGGSEGKALEQRQRERDRVGRDGKPADGVLDQRLRETQQRERASDPGRAQMQARAERDIKSGDCFNEAAMHRPGPTGSRSSWQALEAWRAGGRDGAEARRLGPELGRKSGPDVVQFMAGEVRNGRVENRRQERSIKPDGTYQTMTVWEYADGTVVRYKPDGDGFRAHPTHSVEVKIDRNVRDANGKQDGIAFKVDKNGRAVPRGPNHVRGPTELSQAQREAYVTQVMNAGHMGGQR